MPIVCEQSAAAKAVQGGRSKKELKVADGRGARKVHKLSFLRP